MSPSALQTSPDSKLLGLGLVDTVSGLLGTLPLWKTVGEGEPLTLSIGVDVINLVSLQWYFEGAPIPGANRGTLTLQSVTSAQVGQYQLRATLLGITLVSVPTDVQINGTDGTVDRSAAAFDTLGGAKSQSASKTMTQAKSGGTAHGFSGTQIFSTVGSTRDSGEPRHCGVSGGASEWFAWQPPTNGTAVITTDGSNFDTVLAVYIGPGDSYSTLTNVACDNDSGANGKTSRVVFDVRGGTIYYIAVDGVDGASGTVKLNYTVGTAPEITSQPASRTTALGRSVTLSATASGFPAPRYQWTFKGTNIAGATNASLTLTNICDTHLGTYRFRATNSIGVALSLPAEVRLDPPLRFLAPSRDANGFPLFAAEGPSGTNYLVESSADLTIWSPVFTNRTGAGTFRFSEAGFRTNRHLFYRLTPIP